MKVHTLTHAHYRTSFLLMAVNTLINYYHLDRLYTYLSSNVYIMPLIILCLILFVCLFVCPFVRMMAGRANHLCKVHFDHVHMICALFIRYIYSFCGRMRAFLRRTLIQHVKSTESYTPLRIPIKRDAMSSKTNSIEI